LSALDPGLSKKDIGEVHLAGLIHDIGKIGTQEGILLSAGIEGGANPVRSDNHKQPILLVSPGHISCFGLFVIQLVLQPRINCGLYGWGPATLQFVFYSIPFATPVDVISEIVAGRTSLFHQS
jgi:hypothetical protein